MAARKFLYLCPEFPPSAATGAIRPTRLARLLPVHGWEPVVATLSNGRGRVLSGPFEAPEDEAARSSGTPTPLNELADPAPRGDRFAEWLPFGNAIASQPALYAAGRAALRDHDCDLILLNAPPVAASLTALALAHRAGLPLVVDHRDPWGPCDMRQAERPFWTRWLEAAAERALCRRAARVVLNTETACQDYLAAFPDLPQDRFTWRRNAVDRESLFRAEAAPFGVFTLLFAGGFNRHVSSAPLLVLARALWERGLGRDRLRIALTARPGFGDAKARPEIALFDILPRYSQAALGAAMQASDMLILIGQPTRQRIPLKFYDYLHSDRPVLGIDPGLNTEFAALFAESAMGRLFRPDAGGDMADYVLQHLARERHPKAPRSKASLQRHSMTRAATDMAAILAAAAARPD